MNTAVIAGVGPGLGASLARAFAKEGLAVALLSRRPESSEPVAGEVRAAGGRTSVIPCDVSDRQAVSTAFARIGSDLGTVTVLAYNASGYGRGSFLSLEPAIFREAFEASVLGAVHLAQASIPQMLKAGRGFISFTGATAALRGRAGFAPLATAKSGLRMLAQSLAREFHPQGIHVLHVIVDGQIDTPKLRAREPDRNPATLISPDAIAASMLDIYRQPATSWSHEIDIRPSSETF
jgi:NAD(P)-dependent dehydrogenase (short-subunit alcohol dehydrogenase family)